MLDKKKSVFDDLDALRNESKQLKPPPPAGPIKRARSAEPFARIPYDRGSRLYGKISSTAWAVLIELDRLILMSRGRNPVAFEPERLYAAGIARSTISRALHQLQDEKVIRVERWSDGREGTLITHLWFPVG